MKTKQAVKVVIVFLQAFLISIALLFFDIDGIDFIIIVFIVMIAVMHLDDMYFFPKIFREKPKKFDALKEVDRINSGG